MLWVNNEDRKKYIGKLLRNKFLKNFECRYRMKSGEIRFFLVSSVVIELEGKQCTLNFLKDISEIKKIQKEKEILQDQLIQAQKMEAIGTLAGGIAHDFNNILGAILGYAEMAYEDSLSGSVKPSDLTQVVEASHRAKDLVKQILAFSRQADTQMVPLQPAVLVKESVKLLRSSIPTTIDIRLDIDSETDTIQADPTQIHQIIMNLCTNAYQAMEETGGILSISLKNKMPTQHDLT
jgi:signal transduction histidine kinase